jgi:hypothetical protein
MFWTNKASEELQPQSHNYVNNTTLSVGETGPTAMKDRLLLKGMV